MKTLITAGVLVNADSHLAGRPAVLIEDGILVGISSAENDSLPAADTHHDYPDAVLSPAFFDIHIHGAMGHDVMEGTPVALNTIGKYLATRGVGAWLPTTVTASMESTSRALAGIAKYIADPAGDGAKPLGIHLEGPFISHAKRGVHPPEQIQQPSVDLFTRFWEASEGTIRLMTIAPETAGATELIEHAVELGVRVSLGHSNANTSEARRGIAAGATSATHTFNAMRPLDHRDPGILGTVLDDDALYAELICDGVHVDPAIVRLFHKAKKQDHAILITDGISATGMPEGEYQLGSLTVSVKSGRCTLVDGLQRDVLAGSVLTLDRALRNYQVFTGATLTDTLPLATTNPARLMGFQDCGTLAPGQPANITLLSPAGKVEAVYLQGNKVA